MTRVLEPAATTSGGEEDKHGNDDKDDERNVFQVEKYRDQQGARERGREKEREQPGKDQEAENELETRRAQREDRIATAGTGTERVALSAAPGIHSDAESLIDDEAHDDRHDDPEERDAHRLEQARLRDRRPAPAARRPVVIVIGA